MYFLRKSLHSAHRRFPLPCIFVCGRAWCWKYSRKARGCSHRTPVRRRRFTFFFCLSPSPSASVLIYKISPFLFSMVSLVYLLFCSGAMAFLAAASRAFEGEIFSRVPDLWSLATVDAVALAIDCNEEATRPVVPAERTKVELKERGGGAGSLEVIWCCMTANELNLVFISFSSLLSIHFFPFFSCIVTRIFSLIFAISFPSFRRWLSVCLHCNHWPSTYMTACTWRWQRRCLGFGRFCALLHQLCACKLQSHLPRSLRCPAQLCLAWRPSLPTYSFYYGGLR